MHVNKSVALLLILILLVSFCITIFSFVWADEDSWTIRAPIKTERQGLGVAVVDGKIYAIGGQNDWISPFLDTNEMYDPATNTWTSKTSMPTPRRNFAIAVYKNKIYCISGESGYNPEGVTPVYTDVNEVYDPATDMWETKASIPTPRHGACANVVDGKIYVIGGAEVTPYPGYVTSGKNEVYDPETDTWTEKTSIPTPVNRAASAVVDGRIYVLGGRAGWIPAGYYDFNQVYDVKNDAWSTAAPLPVGVDAAAAGATTGEYAPRRIYVFGGFTEATYTPQKLTQVYDPKNNIWSSGTPMLTPHANFGVAVVNDELYVISGSQENMKPPSVENEKYTPSGYGTPDSFTPSPSPPSSLEPTSTPVPEPEPFPVLPLAVASVAVVVIVGAGLLVYFKKRKR